MYDANLAFHSIDGPFVAFSIDIEMYYARLEPIVQIFNDSLQLQVIPNIDFWIQNKTKQRHDQRGFLDMARAFKAGIEKSYTIADLNSLLQHTMMATKRAMLEQMPEYNKHYWIETLDASKLESVGADNVRKNFDVLLKKLGEDGFYNYLCRLWKFAVAHRPDIVTIFEKLVARLGKLPAEPTLPATPELDNELYKKVVSTVFDKKIAPIKGVPVEIQKRLNLLNGRGA